MKKFLFMIAAVATLFTACDKDCGHDFIEHDYSNDILGTWTCLKDGFAEALVFKADGTFESVGVANGEYWEYPDAIWSLKNNKLALSSGDYKSNVLLEIIPGNSLALVDEKGTRNVFKYCENDLSDEIVGMWVCNETPSAEENDMLIMTYKADGTTLYTGYAYEADVFSNNIEASYKVIGDLLIHKQPDIAVEYGLVQYNAMKIKYIPNGTALGDIKTLQAYAIVGENYVETNTSWLRIKQHLDLPNHKYDYMKTFVTTALAHCLQAGEVDTRIELVLVKDLLQAFTVTDIYLIERYILADDLCNPLQGDRRRVVKVVNYYSLMACLCKFNQGVASDETGTASQ